MKSRLYLVATFWIGLFVGCLLHGDGQPTAMAQRQVVGAVDPIQEQAVRECFRAQFANVFNNTLQQVTNGTADADVVASIKTQMKPLRKSRDLFLKALDKDEPKPPAPPAPKK